MDKYCGFNNNSRVNPLRHSAIMQQAHWFIERGFVESDVSALPAQKKSLYNWQRKSKVFVRKI
jgi:N-acetylglutamate synthase-like GNAT family acetyltransferase